METGKNRKHAGLLQVAWDSEESLGRPHRSEWMSGVRNSSAYTEAHCFWPDWLTTHSCLKPLPSLPPSLKFPNSAFNPLKCCLFFNAYISLNYKVFVHQKSQSPTEVQIPELCTWYAKIIPSDLSLHCPLHSTSCSSCMSFCSSYYSFPNVYRVPLGKYYQVYLPMPCQLCRNDSCGTHTIDFVPTWWTQSKMLQISIHSSCKWQRLLV